MKIKFLILTFILALLSHCMAADAPLDSIFVRAIHQVETSGKFGAIKGDKGNALGPFQIHRHYWKDSGVEGSYEQCADYKYSVRVMTAYMNRYGREYITSKNYEALARLHNGGPNWRKKDQTAFYWLKVKKEMYRLREMGYVPALLSPYRHHDKMVVFVMGQPMTDYVLQGSINGSDWYTIETINSANNGFAVFRVTAKPHEMLRAYWVDSELMGS